MGACNGGGTFIDSNWRRGIALVQEEAEREYGHREGYSGAANSCNFRYFGEKLEFGKNTKKAQKDLDTFIEHRMDMLGSGDGEIICIGIEYYGIISTEISETNWAPFDSRYYLKSMKKGPAILLEPYDYVGQGMRVIAEGTIADLKKRAHMELRRNKYDKDLYIVGKTKTYVCSGKIKQQKVTKRESQMINFWFYLFISFCIMGGIGSK